MHDDQYKQYLNELKSKADRTSHGFYDSISLPVGFNEMDHYIKFNKRELIDTVVDAIECGIKNNLDCVDVFKFENSNFSVSISKSEFKTNLLFLLESSKNKEEASNRISKLLDLLENNHKTEIIPHVKKEKKTKSGSKKQSVTRRKSKRSDGPDKGSK